jgi:hypothetical protein
VKGLQDESARFVFLAQKHKLLLSDLSQRENLATGKCMAELNDAHGVITSQVFCYHSVRALRKIRDRKVHSLQRNLFRHLSAAPNCIQRDSHARVLLAERREEPW